MSAFEWKCASCGSNGQTDLHGAVAGLLKFGQDHRCSATQGWCGDEGPDDALCCLQAGHEGMHESARLPATHWKSDMSRLGGAL